MKTNGNLTRWKEKRHSIVQHITDITFFKTNGIGPGALKGTLRLGSTGATVCYARHRAINIIVLICFDYRSIAALLPQLRAPTRKLAHIAVHALVNTLSSISCLIVLQGLAGLPKLAGRSLHRSCTDGYHASPSADIWRDCGGRGRDPRNCRGFWTLNDPHILLDFGKKC